MKSGPTLAAAGRCPAARRAARRPVVTVVLPTPEWVPATTSRDPRSATKVEPSGGPTVRVARAAGSGSQETGRDLGEFCAHSTRMEVTVWLRSPRRPARGGSAPVQRHRRTRRTVLGSRRPPRRRRAGPPDGGGPRSAAPTRPRGRDPPRTPRVDARPTPPGRPRPSGGPARPG